MPVMKLRVEDRTALAAYLISLWDGAVAAGPCHLEVYDGAMPATTATALAGQVKLGTLTCSDPLGDSTTTPGVLTFGTITQDDAADANGTAAWCRLVDADGVVRAMFDVSNGAGTGVLKLNTVTIVAGGPIRVTSFAITLGA